MRRRELFVLIVLCASGCVSVTGPRALRPAPPGASGTFERVETLTPVLEWEPAADPPGAAASPEDGTVAAQGPGVVAVPVSLEPVRYDVAVHVAEYQPATFTRPERRWPGARVYHREGLATTSHRVEEPLAPGRNYYWFVRTRRGDLVGPWSRYGYFLFLGVGWVSATNMPYRFRTPDAAASGGEAPGSGGAGSVADSGSRPAPDAKASDAPEPP